MNDHVIINADDFGMSRGVNQAIIDAHKQGALTHASIIVTGRYLDEAVAMAKVEAPGLKLGLHIDLRQGFLSLLLRCATGNKAFEEQLTREIEAQILKLQNMDVVLTHLDGHRHIHMIPMIWRIVNRLAAIHHISHIRLVNESLAHTIHISKDRSFLWNGGLVKYVILKLLAICNGASSSRYFFSILHSCQITPELLAGFSIPEGYDSVEIMLHPGHPEMDKDDYQQEYQQIVSPYRLQELETAVALKHYDWVKP